ncbi:MAG: sugar kinase [Jaaginema sp. PMC 1080.18]|nr:sugar kinase [Jaaginema sp. PMC 1080.18]MEC4868706.1 sugar kinase [Jaaginema sp. PMC 1078.18]
MKGLFLGLSTLDLIYRVERLPQPNEKIVALDAAIAAGGPATNAAVTFAHLGGEAQLCAAIGQHPNSNLIRTDLDTQKVAIADLTPQATESPPVSSILVTAATGDRAVVSLNAQKQQVNTHFPPNFLDKIDIILIDGHQMAASREIARQAKQHQIPIVIDGGSWKSGFETVLPYADYAICSANFHPPNCTTTEQVFANLVSLNIAHIAITQGAEPILYRTENASGRVAIDPIEVVDTLGAGDIFHGAFCYFILHQDFTTALQSASQIAAKACQSFGTRVFLGSRS